MAALGKKRTMLASEHGQFLTSLFGSRKSSTESLRSSGDSLLRSSSVRNSNEKTFSFENGTSQKLNRVIPYVDMEEGTVQFSWSVFAFLAISISFCTMCQASIKAIGYMHLKEKVHQTPAKILLHVFGAVSMVAALPGGIVADIFGRYRTALAASIIGVAGACTTAGAEFIGENPSAHLAMSLTGLFLVAATNRVQESILFVMLMDQISLTKNPFKTRVTEFILGYHAQKQVSFILSMVIATSLREKVHCFQRSTCNAAVFGFAATCTLLGVVSLALCRQNIVEQQLQKDACWEACRCVLAALKNRIIARDAHFYPHWMDFAVRSGYSVDLIVECKANSCLLLLGIPIMGYGLVYLIKVTSFIDMASRMNGTVSDAITIQPDVMYITNPTLSLLLTLLLLFWLNAKFQKWGILFKLLHKLVFGMGCIFACGLASVLLAYYVAQTDPVVPGNSEVMQMLINTMEVQAQVNHMEVEPEPRALATMNPNKLLHGDHNWIDPFSSVHYILPKDNVEHIFEIYVPFHHISQIYNRTYDPSVKDLAKSGLIWTPDHFQELQIKPLPGPEIIARSIDTKPIVRIISPWVNPLVVVLSSGPSNFSFFIPPGSLASEYKTGLQFSPYAISIENMVIGSHRFSMGSVNSVIILEEGLGIGVIETIPGGSIHIFYQLPLYFLQALAEVFFYNSCRQLFYEDSPPQLRAVMMSFIWFFLGLSEFALMPFFFHPVIGKSWQLQLILSMICLVAFLFLIYMADQYVYYAERRQQVIMSPATGSINPH